MEEPFGGVYASAYDSIYAEKDYERECDLLEDAFERFAAGTVRSVLDLGAGTGNHALPLVRRGYAVTGVDLSTAMVEIARGKAREAGIEVDFHQGDLRTTRLGREFDAALLMFAVLGYQRTDADVRTALRTARTHVRSGGVLVFDVWHGPAVLAEPPGDRHRLIRTPEGEVSRSASAELDVEAGLCTVRYELEGSGRETRETHVMRFYFPGELERFLDEAGFELTSLSAFDDLDAPATVESWTATVVARSV